MKRVIRRLTAETASRIAAGEVVDRPLAALKEILENALDAGARNIDVRVQGGLDHWFEVADDGEGLAPDDLPIAFERHATSKLENLSDLDALTTLGFRGEALPSVAAVSRVRMTSAVPGAESGAFLALEGGIETGHGPAARARGTTVQVSDLFYNVPARRKFLSSPAGELRAALRMIECCALSRFDVAFRVTVDEKLKHEWPAAADERERCGQLWSARHAEQRLWAEGERDGVRVRALLGLPEHARANREGQVLIVNRRWIQSALLTQALRQAYGSLLPPGRYPSAVLWITVPPARLDVNVHPTKREVRFADDERVFSLVAGTCARPLAKLHPPFHVVPGAAPEPAWADRVRESPRQQTSLGFQPATGESAAAEAYGAPSATGLAPAAVPAAEPELWQLHRTYILAPVRGGLVIIDQHAAHERILYEEALERLNGQRGASQRLLFPALVDLAAGEFDLLLEIAPQLELLGWDLAPLGPPTVMIQGVPTGLRQERPGTLLQDVLDGLGEDTAIGGSEARLERIARSHACHAATRAGDVLGAAEMRALVDRLFATSHPHGDPHGRVTFVRLGLDELHRRFGRS